MSFHHSIPEKLKRLPKKPGVYQFLNDEGMVIYVGKAKVLKNRVSSYFTKSKRASGKTRMLVSKVREIEVIVVETELDALLLENSLIKKYQPRYNMLLKDDKSFPSIVIKNERFPRIFSTRQLLKDGSEYFGPYANVRHMQKVLKLIKKLYPTRTCSYNLSQENISKGKYKKCLEFHLGNCKAPCEDLFSEKEYMANVDAIRQVIKGNLSPLIKKLKSEMQAEAEKMRFEIAHELKGKINLLEGFQTKSTIVNPSIRNTDVFTMVSDGASAYVNFMKVNNGVIVQAHSTEIRRKLEETDEEIIQMAIHEIRKRVGSDSKEVFLPFPVDLQIPGVKAYVPQKGDKKKLLELSERNARMFLRDRQKQQEAIDPDMAVKRILNTLQSDLRLKELPRHIECFDNSNIQGANPVSACVVFKNAKPSKKDYRNFNIKTVEGPDDFASMEEAVFRRYRRVLDEENSLPNLLVIDGGKGQLSSAVKALRDLGIYGQLPVIGIAKRLEEIYFPGDSIPIYLDKRSESLKVIQHLRNEAHRFSLSHHRKRRSKGALQSELTAINGVGEVSAQKLFRHFKSYKKISEASRIELEVAVSKAIAARVHVHFYKKDT